jgi:hypothetical protein
LDVREDKVLVEINGLLVVFSSVAELGFNKVELCAVVVNVRIVLVLGESRSEISFGGLRIGFWS